MRKGVTAVSPSTAPVLCAAEILSSLYPFVALQDLTPQMGSGCLPQQGQNVGVCRKYSGAGGDEPEGGVDRGGDGGGSSVVQDHDL